MKKLGCIAIFCFIMVASMFAQKRIIIPLDDDREAIVYIENIENINEQSFKGYIIINDTNTNKELLKVEVPDFGDDDFVAQVDENLDINEQEWVLYEDFNFDGIPDVAIINGQLSDNDMYKYNVYLGTDDDNFSYNADFSEVLSQGGLPGIDVDKKQLLIVFEDDLDEESTAINTYKIEDNKPVLIVDK